MKYEVILFDADDTLFDFQSAAKNAFLRTSESFRLPCEEEYFSVFAPINQKYWDLFSLGKIDKPTLLTARFLEYAEKIGVSFDPSGFSKSYGEKLAASSLLIDGARETLASLSEGGIRLYLVTNGISYVQRGRLKAAGIDGFFQGLFISDEIGRPKPDAGFCEAVKKGIAAFSPDRTLVCGDSVLTDVAFGRAIGADTCLFAPRGDAENSGATYVVGKLPDLLPVAFDCREKKAP